MQRLIESRLATFIVWLAAPFLLLILALRQTHRKRHPPMTPLDLKLKKIHPDAQPPRYATPGAFCFDLHSIHRGVVAPGAPAVFGTGLAMEIPAGYALLIFPRSGHGFNRDTRLANCIGVIDDDYRGEVKVKLTQDEAQSGALIVAAGDRIAQAALFPKILVNFLFVDELSDSDRGQGGFGSTGY